VLLVLAVDALRYYRINFSRAAPARAACDVEQVPRDRQPVRSFRLRGYVAFGQPEACGACAARGIGRNFRRAERGAETLESKERFCWEGWRAFSRPIHRNESGQPGRCGCSRALSRNLFLAWMYITVRASQVVAGLVFNVLALGSPARFIGWRWVIPPPGKHPMFQRCTFHF